MKRFGLLVLTLILSGSILVGQSKKSKDDMIFDKTVNGITAHDFGSIVYGANGKVDFSFTNNGTKDLIINDVKSSCGCAVPIWPKEPVKPGQKGTIQIEYNTKLAGPFNKTIVVYSTANNSPVRLEIRGKVNAQPSDLKPGKTSTPGGPTTIDARQDDGQIQKSAASSSMENSEEKAAREQSFKKLTEQQTPPPDAAKSQVVQTSSDKKAQTGVKKK